MSRYAGQVLLKLATEWDYNQPRWAKTAGEWTIPGWPHRDAWDAMLAGDRQGVTKLKQWYPPEDRDIWNGILGLEPYAQAAFVRGKDKMIVQSRPSQLSLQQASLFNKNRHLGQLNENQIYVAGIDGQGGIIGGTTSAATSQGLQGQTYGFSVREPGRHSVSLPFIDDQVNRLYYQASQRPDLEFIVPPINEGIPGLTEGSVIDRFTQKPVPPNVSLPGSVLYPHYKGLKGSTYALTENDLFGDYLTGYDPRTEQFRNRWSQLEGWNEHYLRKLMDDGGGVIYQFQYQPIKVTAKDNSIDRSGLYGEMTPEAVRRAAGRY